MSLSRVYLSELHSPIGYHLVDLFRTDHTDPHNPTIIVGSSSLPPSGPISHTFNFAQYPQVCCRALMDCDLVILLLDNPSHEAEVLIRFLEHSHAFLSKPLRVIGLSSVMTWEALRCFQLQQEGEREKMLGAIIDESNWRRRTWTEGEYLRRIPNNFYVRTYQLENLLLKLNRHPNINATVLSHGMLYAKENAALQSDIMAGLRGEGLACFGNGQNLIPLTHMETLLESIEQLVGMKEVPFTFAIDSQQFSQKEVKQLIAEATGSKQPLTFKEQLFLSREECDWSINLTAHSLLPQLASIATRRNLKQYLQTEMMADICDYTTYRPRQHLVIIEKFTEEQLTALREELSGECLIMQEELERIEAEIVTKLTPVEPEPVKKQKNSVLKAAAIIPEKEVVHYYKEAWQALLGNKKYRNIVIICREALLSSLDHQLLFERLVQILPQQEQAPPATSQDFIYFHSEEYYAAFSLSPPENTGTASQPLPIQSPTESTSLYRSQSAPRKDEQLVLLNQYLLDNVLLPISEAKFALKNTKKTPTLHNFIAELKAILNRNNAKGGQGSRCDP